MTDEQRKREQFEKWIDEKQYGLGWQDGRGTWEEFLSATWAGYQAGQLARDAEVQALRKALSQLRVMAQVCIDRKAINPISHHTEALMLAEYLDKADAALVGGEKGTDDE